MTHAAPRTLMLFPQTFGDGGIQRFNRTLLAASARIGQRCDVLSLLDAAPLAHGYVGGSMRGFGGRKPEFALAVLRGVASGHYDRVVVGHVNFAVLAAAAAALRWKKPELVLIAHGEEVWSGVRGMRRRALHVFDRILCVSAYTRQRLHEQAASLDPAVFSVFPNAIAQSWMESVDTVERDVAVPDLTGRFILAVGRLDRPDRTKGLITTIEALSGLADRDLQLAVAGRGDDLSFLRNVAIRCGVAQRVRFLGRVPDAQLRALYQQCEAFVLPSGQEGFGIVFLEAMYFGAPVIAAQAKGAVDVVQNEMTGLSVDYGDVVGLRDAISRLIGDAGLRERLRHAGRALVTETGAFTFSAFVDRWRAVVEHLPRPAQAQDLSSGCRTQRLP